MDKADPITFAVVRNKLISIANGMQETGFRTGVTTFMYEIMDCSFAILDADAGVIAQSPKGILLFLRLSEYCYGHYIVSTYQLQKRMTFCHVSSSSMPR